MKEKSYENKEGDAKVSPFHFKKCKICNKEKQSILFHKTKSTCSDCSKTSRRNDKHRLCDFKNSARRRGLKFYLSDEEFSKLRSQECFYCGTKEDNMSIDRINSSEGYSYENCLPCCISCNTMKFDLNVDLFLKKVSKIYHRHRAAGNIDG